MLSKNFEPVLRFVVCSDIHIKKENSVERERLRQCIKTGYALCENEKYNRLDAFYVVGDMGDHGTPEEFEAIKKIFDEELKGETALNCSIASHEFSFEGEERAKERLFEYFGLEPSTHRVINGFHFISIGCTCGCHFKENEREEAIKALEEARKDDPQKPIFFFQHPHIFDTVYGSIAWGEDELTDILINYPQVIDFSGHSHCPVNDPRSIHQKHFTSLGTGTLSYFEMDEFDKTYGTIPDRSHEAAQMLLVEADKDGRVRIYPYDLISGNFFGYIWEIDEPWNPQSFKYTDERYKTTEKPWFEEGARVELSFENGNLTATFPQARVNSDRVDCYQAVLKDKNGLQIRKINIFSGYYLYDMPKSLSVTFENVEKGDYAVEIYAESFWKTVSEPLKGLTPRG